MAQPGVWLAVQVGGSVTRALVRDTAGGWRPVRLEGTEELPSAVFIATDGKLHTAAEAQRRGRQRPTSLVADPRQHLLADRVEIAGVVVAGVELTVAVLRRVAELARATPAAAADVGQVVLVTPAGWGPRRRTAMRRAARRAGLGEVVLVDSATAVARYAVATGVACPPGGWLLLVELDSAVAATVIRRTPDGFDMVASIDAATGPARLEQDLAERLVDLAAAAGPQPEGPDGAAMLAAVRAVLRTWPPAPAVVVPLPAPWPAVVVTAELVQAVAGAAVDGAVQVARRAVEAADADTATGTGVFVVGQVPAVADATGRAVGAALGLPATVFQPSTTLLGAVGATGGPAAASNGDDTTPSVWQAVGVLVPGAAALGLFLYLVAGTDVDLVAGSEFRVVFGWGILSMAAVLAALTCLNLAVVVTGAMPSRPAAPAPPIDGRRLGAGLVAAAGAGTATAALFAAVAAASLATPAGPFLRWALWPVLPVALAAAACGVLLVARYGRGQAGRVDWWLPTSVTAAAGAGMALVLQAGRTPAEALSTLLYWCGGLLVGAAAGWLLADRPRWRLLAAAPLAVFTGAITSVATVGVIAVLFTAAVTGWWLRRLWRVAIAGPAPSAAAVPR